MGALEHFSWPFSSPASYGALASCTAFPSTSGDRRALHPRCDPAIAECRPSRRNLRNQVFVSQSLSSNGINKTVQPFQRVALHVARVQSKGKFVNVATQMLRAHLVVHAVNTALEHRPNA